MNSQVLCIETNEAPKAIGPYSQGVVFNNLIFVSGQLPISPVTGDLITGDIKEQTRQILINIDNILKAANSGYQNIVKVNIYLTNLNDFPLMNQVYADFFGTHKPARATVGVNALVKGAQIEIDVIAYVNN